MWGKGANLETDYEIESRKCTWCLCLLVQGCHCLWSWNVSELPKTVIVFLSIGDSVHPWTTKIEKKVPCKIRTSQGSKEEWNGPVSGFYLVLWKHHKVSTLSSRFSHQRTVLKECPHIPVVLRELSYDTNGRYIFLYKGMCARCLVQCFGFWFWVFGLFVCCE